MDAQSFENEEDETIYSRIRIGNDWTSIEGVTQRFKESVLLELLQTMQERYYWEPGSTYYNDYVREP